MAESRRLRPWWERHAEWWAEQQRALEVEWGSGEYRYDDTKHVAVWSGRMPAPAAIDVDQVDVQILWRSGTPFLPPQVFIPGCFSAVHQLGDSSLCLLAPAGHDEGWEGCLEIGRWLDLTSQWLHRWATEKWMVPPEWWVANSLLLPHYLYRRPMIQTRVVLLPPSWAEPTPGFGKVVVRRSADSRKSAVVGWSRGKDKPQIWPGGSRLIGGDFVDVAGIWSFTEERLPPSHRRKLERLRKRVFEDARAAGRDAVVVQGDEVQLAGGSIPTWAANFVPLADQPQLMTMSHALRMRDALLQPAAGFALDAPTLDARRLAGRSLEMHEKIRSADVLVVGLGSLGSEVVHLLAKEGVVNFQLVDADLFLPGNEARHRASLDNSGDFKVDAMRDQILRIQPEAKVVVHREWIDDLLPKIELAVEGIPLVIGCTGDEGAEQFLDDACRDLGLPVLHAWLEVDGSVLRLARSLPDRDPPLALISKRGGVPKLPKKGESGARECAETVLPCSAVNIHAAANFVVQHALRTICGPTGGQNHWLFAPSGSDHEDVPEELWLPYGQLSFSLAS